LFGDTILPYIPSSKDDELFTFSNIIV